MTMAFYECFSSRSGADFQDKLISDRTMVLPGFGKIREVRATR
jgi:hypothetical protein